MVNVGKMTSDWMLKNNDATISKWKSSVKLLEGLSIFMEIVYLLVAIPAALIEAIFTFLLPQREKQLTSDIILVTGSGHGIGRELTIKLAAEGATVVGWDLDEEGNAETYKILKDMGLHQTCHFYNCNVADRKEVLETAAAVQKEIGSVTILVNNAGIMCCKPINEQSAQIVERIFQVNALSNFWTIEAFLPKMRELNAGHIVSTCSMCGIIGLPLAVPYSASKFAVRGLMEALHEEMRKNETTNNIKFTTIFPITVNTGLAKKPKHRFPSLFNILEPDEVAAQIVTAIKRETYELTLPTSLMAFDKITRLLPRKATQLIMDFLDTGVYAE